ncbi:trypsin-like peptidase domain-containing protein [Loktanella agnita]|uniref:trypsin-like peptidase domain-containing protein n=1 Tax=Loktanella agnita TaxID=287097 RepID=UPI003986BEF3
MIRLLFIILCCLAPPLDAQERVPQSQAEISLTFAPLVKQAAPAVVNIYAQRLVQARSPFAGDPFFGDMFRQQRPRVQNSLGSGVILSADGIVVSNYHVVGQATDIRVVLKDGREHIAEVLLGDEEADLAILQMVDAADMPHLALRDSDTVEVGELVLAIGNPFGVGQTVSSGIVSGLARSGAADGGGRGYFIQTDAPINPGNSGGALIDVAGRLIGVNTSILTRSGGSNGIGFAIPAALVQQFVEQARAGNRSLQRPWLGFSGQDVTADLARGFAMARPGGVVVTALHPVSPLQAAELQVGDVIVEVDGHPVNTSAEMLYRMTVAGIGASVDVTYVREQQRMQAQITLAVAPNQPPREPLTLDRLDVLPGLTASVVNPAVIAELDLPLFAEGVVVTDPGPYGERVGLAAGDLIRAINGVAIVAPSDIASALHRAGRRIRIDAQRGNRRLTLRFGI